MGMNTLNLYNQNAGKQGNIIQISSDNSLIFSQIFFSLPNEIEKVSL